MSIEKGIMCSFTPGIYAEGYIAFVFLLYNGENSVSGLYTFEWFALIAEKTTFAHWYQVSDRCLLGYLFNISNIRYHRILMNEVVILLLLTKLE